MLYPWLWGRLQWCSWEQRSSGCSEAEEVSAPGVTIPLQRKKQKKGMNSYCETSGDRSVRAAVMEVQTGWLGEGIDLVSGKTGNRITVSFVSLKDVKMDIATRKIGGDDTVWGVVEDVGWRSGRREEKKEE